MSTTSTNLGLILPFGSEKVSRSDYVANLNLIDSKTLISSDVSEKPCQHYYLLTKTELTSSYATKNVVSGRLISDYDWLVFVFERGDWVVDTMTIPVSVFTADTGVAGYYKFNNDETEFDIKYVDDTSVSIKKTTTDTEHMYVRILAIVNATITK